MPIEGVVDRDGSGVVGGGAAVTLAGGLADSTRCGVDASKAAGALGDDGIVGDAAAGGAGGAGDAGDAGECEAGGGTATVATGGVFRRKDNTTGKDRGLGARRGRSAFGAMTGLSCPNISSRPYNAQPCASTTPNHHGHRGHR